MSLAIVNSRAQVGINAPPVAVEVHLANGLPRLSIAGLPETAVKESKDRVRGAILNSNFEYPNKHITVNLAPADLPKEGGRFDLPIALGILAASGQIQGDRLSIYEFVGELGLSGELRPVRGVLPVSIAATKAEKKLCVPFSNANEAALVENAEVIPARHLLELSGHFNCTERLTAYHSRQSIVSESYPDLADVRGQEGAKRALEIAAAGGHHLLFVGPPGAGKTMLATRLPGILPPLTEEEALESAAIHSLVKQHFDVQRWRQRPFRNPHHSASAVALVGGGSHPRPGEISLAHKGILFLDELPEFETRVLDQLREPLSSRQINISRAACQISFPAEIQLVCAMNPCKCGYLGDGEKCRCTSENVHRYRSKISGPLMDRIDIQVHVPAAPRDVLRKKPPGESSNTVRQRVAAARMLQLKRSGFLNHQLDVKQLETYCVLDTSCDKLLDTAMEKLGISVRAYHSILRVARTIADLERSDSIKPAHIAEAIGYRSLDRC